MHVAFKHARAVSVEDPADQKLFTGQLMSITDFLKPLNNLAHRCECMAQDYAGDLKSQLSTQYQLIHMKEFGYEAPEIQATLPKLESALQNYPSSKKHQGAMFLASVRRE